MRQPTPTETHNAWVYEQSGLSVVEFEGAELSILDALVLESDLRAEAVRTQRQADYARAAELTNAITRQHKAAIKARNAVMIAEEMAKARARDVVAQARAA